MPATAKGKPEVTFDSIEFRVGVEWPEADVDVVYSERGGLFQGDRAAASRTPTADSVDVFLLALHADKQIQAAGLRVSQWYGLMMGCCHAIFRVEMNEAEAVRNLPALIRFARERMEALVAEHVRYYPKGQTVRASRVAAMVRG